MFPNKQLLHQTNYMIRTPVSRPTCKSPTHHHHPFAHSCLPFPSLANPHRPRPPCNLLPPTVPSCTVLLPWQLPAGVQLGGGICDEVSSCPLISSPRCKMPHPRYKFLPHLLMPSVPPLIASPHHHHPFCKFPPAPPNSPLANPPASKSSCPSPAPFSANPCLPYPLFPNMRP